MLIVNNNFILEKTINQILKCEYKFFLNKSNVVGIGLGYKIKNGFYTNQLCVQVFVTKKILLDNLSCNDLVPRIYKNIPTDVVETGIFTACALKKRIRPVLGGYSISNASINHYSGTASCLVTNGVSNFVLSSTHALSNNFTQPIGSPIVQPATKYGGRPPNDTIATLHKYIPIRYSTETSQPINSSDCALGLLTKPNILSPKIDFIGKLNGTKRAILNEEVRKVGTTSELTKGKVLNPNATIEINFSDGKRAAFQDLITTTRMLSPGDSGAILVNKHNYGLGMGLSGSNTTSSYCRLDIALDQLDVKLVT
ncbi:hypothetical protein G8T76_12420 [Clostridium botulinum C/D]|nr:hypothetical protein [Clostridium botulinum]MCD3198599.1 hypothetical protein [Clostridium botulinum C/D]MCD3202168.1 hypothetical protein [Clostridium botulinum C/D]MCD3212194.1 hypothetical protein [Clostridium botulinum C/D]MCD3215212.1 hypothetical protein [Clostridium botulinum C/D]MCD3222250.1 hypothetical protein [Clostridium botulinum C/D]